MNTQQTLKEYTLITLGLILYAFGFVTLLLPAQTVPGGAGGVSTLLFHLMGGTGHSPLDFGTIYFLVNAILLSIGTLIIGFRFGIKTIYAVVVISTLMNLFTSIIPADFTGLSIEGGDQLLMVIMGSIMCGVGVGLCFTQGGSSGGTDIIAMVINKFYNISFGRVIMICDVIIISCSILVFKGDLKPAIYGFVTLGIIGYTIDLVISGTKQSSQIMVYSQNCKDIGKVLMAEAKRGVTYLHADGGYTGNEIRVLTMVCRKNEQSKILQIIKSVDPEAFITSASVMGVYGKGFDTLKVKTHKKN